jgi:hypothetical protein
MTYDGNLLKALVEQTEYYRESAPVFRIQRRPLVEKKSAAITLAQRFAEDLRFKSARYALREKRHKTVILLPENLSASVYHASGVVALSSGLRPFEQIISLDVEAKSVDPKQLIAWAEKAVERIPLHKPPEGEALRFERLWQLKASGINEEGKRGPVTLTRAVGALRRYIDGLPVWGPASVYVKVASEGMVASAGVDWRPIHKDPIDQAKVIDPDEGGKRVLAELQTYQPGTTFTERNYRPDFFALGYLSLPKRREQEVFQPVWVAMFRAQGKLTLSRLIVVPAAPTPLEPIHRIPAHPPYDAAKPAPGRRSGG